VNRYLLERASRMFNATADLRDDRDREINEWFKAQLEKDSRPKGCPDHLDDPYPAGCPDCRAMTNPAPPARETGKEG
jgi:hypothetical protein